MNAMDAMPETFYYVPLPRPPSVRIRRGAFSSSGARRRLRCGLAMVETWWAAHTLEVVLSMLGVVMALAVGVLVVQL